MTAVSTALRFRNRSQQDDAVVADSISGLQANNDRVLFDSASIFDSETVTHHRLVSGDSLNIYQGSVGQFNTHERILSDSLLVVDNVIKVKSTRKNLFSSAFVTDEGFITDKDLLRYRLSFDSFAAIDNYQKTITRAAFVIYNKTISESIDVSDSTLTQIGGVIQRTLSDSISVSDEDNLETLKKRLSTLNVSDDNVELRLNSRRAIADVDVVDDIIVGRSAITNSRTLSDSITTFDQALINFVSGRGKSAKILHGIENY